MYLEKSELYQSILYFSLFIIVSHFYTVLGFTRKTGNLKLDWSMIRLQPGAKTRSEMTLSAMTFSIKTPSI